MAESKTKIGDHEVVCGTVSASNSFRMSRGCQSAECDRTYFTYFPTTVCDRYNERQTASPPALESSSLPSLSDLKLPVVFVIHCFGCTASNMYQNDEWIQVAERFRLVLVFPEGHRRSWNAVNCCGEAQEKKIDDVAFIDGLMSSFFSEELALKYPFLSASAHYATGYSNGGFLVTHAASLRPNLFRAVAPISGYVNIDEAYSNATDIATSTAASDLVPSAMPPASRSVGLLVNHARDDPLVRFTGCCSDPTMPKCCCLVSEERHLAPSKCMSAERFAHQWAAKNNACGLSDQPATTATPSSPSADLSMVVSRHDPDLQFTCTTYTGGCRANTTLCVHETGGHLGIGKQNRQRLHEIFAEIGNFFAHDACVNLGNAGTTWSRDSLTCVCPRDPSNQHHSNVDGFLPYCSLANEGRPSLDKVATPALVPGQGVDSFQAIQMAAVAFLVLLIYAVRRFWWTSKPRHAKHRKPSDTSKKRNAKEGKGQDKIKQRSKASQATTG